MLSVIGLAVVLAVFVGSSAAASTDDSRNTDPPTIAGTPQEGKTLTGDRGDWDNNPTDFDYSWLRCNRDGGDCSRIDDADSREYTLKLADVGHTIRFGVEARNSDGRTPATSVPSAVIVAAASKLPVSTSPPVVSGTPQGGKTLTASRGNWDTRRPLPRHLQLRRARAGALVYATATPYNQFSIPPEATTGSGGWQRCASAACPRSRSAASSS